MTNSIDSTTHFIHIPGSKNGLGRGVLVRREIAQVLAEFSRSGNYHKITLVKLLQGLTAGHDHQDNILQPENPAARKQRQFVIELPGCMAEVILHPNGNYYVDNIASRSTENGAANSTGLYKAEKTLDTWSTEYKDHVDIDDGKEVTRVAITDAFEESDDAATQGAKSLSGSDYVTKSVFNHFYLHHTFGVRSITGYVRRKSITQPLSIKELRESSKRLAETMMMARTESQNMPGTADNRKHMAWVSSRGGSAVLTQALAILKQRGISFHGHNHHVFFHEIASDADQAVTLALDLGFKVPAKPFSKRLWSFTSLAVGGGHSAINHRVKAEAKYTRPMAALDHANNAIVPAMGILGAGCLVSGSAVAGIALISIARKAYAGVMLADSIASDVAGKQYEAIKRKAGLLR